MKVLILADITAPYRIAVFKGLAKAYDIDLFFNTATSEQRDPKWYSHADDELNFYLLNSPEAEEEYNSCIKNIKAYDFVLCYDPWHKRSRALQKLCKKKGIPYALNADGALDINMSFPKKQIKTFYTKRAPLLFAGCLRAEEYFKAYGGKPERIVRHPFTSLNESQILKTPYTPADKAEFKASLGMEQKTTFLAVGQFIHRKGFDILLSAWAKTSQDGQLYIIGGGPKRAEYEQMIKDNDLKNVYIEDFKKPDELQKYYSAADVFVMPTREDIWGLVVNEAMAQGLPVISSDRCTSGIELVDKDKNGFVYPCENTDMLAEYIEKLAFDTEMRAEFSVNSLSAINRYTLENIIESHIESITRLMAKQ